MVDPNSRDHTSDCLKNASSYLTVQEAFLPLDKAPREAFNKEKKRIRFGKVLLKWGLRILWNETPTCGSSSAGLNLLGQKAKAGGQQLPPHPAWHPALPQLPSVCARGQDTIHVILKLRCWEVNPEVNPGPYILTISFHYIMSQFKVSSDLLPRFSNWGFQACWSASCPTSPSARLRHSHFFRLDQNSSEAQLAVKAIRFPTLWCIPQHLHCGILRTLTGSAKTAKTHLALFRKKIHWQSIILQTSHQATRMFS